MQGGKASEILDLLPVGILLVGRDKTIRWANREALTLLGAEDLKEVVGRSCQGYLCPSDVCPVFEEGKGEDRSLRTLLRKDGTKVPVIKTVKETELEGEKVLLETFIEATEEGLERVYFERVFEGTEAIMFLVEEDLSVSKVNSAFLKRTGYGREEILRRNALELIHPEDRPLVLEIHRSCLEGKNFPSPFEIRFLTKDGGVLWGLISPTVIPQSRQVIVSGVDFTESKETNKLLESVFMSAPIPIFVAQEGRFRMVNPELILRLGHSEAELMEMSPMDVVHPEDREWVREASKKMLKGERTEPYEFRVVRKDGSIGWDIGMVTSVTYRGKRAVLGYFMSVDQQKKLQEELAREKARTEALIENAPLLIVGLGERSKILLFNRFAEKVTGYKREEVLGKEWIGLFIPPELRGELYKVWEHVVNTRALRHEYENPIQTRDGSWRIIKWYNSVITEGGKFRMVLSMGEDITERRRLEHQMRMMLEGIPNPAWLISRDRKIVAQNRAAHEFFNTQEGQYCWEGIWKLRFLPEEQRRLYLDTGYPPPGTRCVFCEADRVLEEKAKMKKEIQADEAFWETWWVAVSEDLFLHYADDITPYKRMERQLYQMSVTDPLTGAYNRRYFQERLEEEIERAKRTGETFSVVMLDIDHFKAINDRFGHRMGDLVLKALVKAVKDRIRKTDLLTRWGGEEFILLLPATPLEKAKILAEDLRQRIEGLKIPGVEGFTVSLGVTEYQPGDNPDTLISRADDLMYEAKKEGRNRVKAR